MSLEGVDYIPNIGLVLNHQKKGVFTVISRVIKWLEGEGISYLVEKEAAALINNDQLASYAELRERADLVIVFGGDGTFLQAAHHFFTTDIPLLGVNIGRLGFLTEIETNELETALIQLLNGNFKIEKRMILVAKVISNGVKVYQSQALNDIVLHRGSSSNMLGIELFINDQIVNSYRADGLIIATPTGSTAYSLSAGGPIINPNIREIILTPICPHTLYVRPMVIADYEKLRIIVTGNTSMKLNADGRYDFNLSSKDEIYLSAAKEELSIVKLPERTFYTILHKKMRVGLV